MNLLNDIMHDGSRNFVLLPVGKISPIKLVFRIFTLRGAYPTGYIPSFNESWIDFRYKGQKFSINNQYGDYWFFAKNSECPESLLKEISVHFAKFLNETNSK